MASAYRYGDELDGNRETYELAEEGTIGVCGGMANAHLVNAM